MLNWDSSPHYPFADDLFSTESTQRWERLKQQLPIGTLLTGAVYTQAPFGVFYDAGVGFPVLLRIVEFTKKQGPTLFPTDYPALDSVLTGKLVGFNDRSHQLDVMAYLLPPS